MSDELVNSAVTFLQDPKVADAPLAKRIAFLESKGLSSEQVQVALQRAQDAATGQQPYTNHQAASNLSSHTPPSRPLASYTTYQQQQAPPPLPQRDWRDWFIMAVVSGGFSWAVYFLAKRYVIPLMSPPTPTQLDADKESVTAQFDQVQEMLSILQKDTEEIKSHGTEQNRKIEEALTNVDQTVQEVKSKTERRENDIRRLGLEMDQLREMIPKAIEQVRTAQSEALTDLSGELRSLKTLLQNRIKATAAPTVGMGNSSSPSNVNAPSALGGTGINGHAAAVGGKGTASTTTGPTGGSVSHVSHHAAQQSSSTASSSGVRSGSSTSAVPDPLARFTSRVSAGGAGGGIPEWQKSAPAAGASSSSNNASAPGTGSSRETASGGDAAPAGSVEATSANVSA